MDVALESPILPMDQHRGKRICECSLDVGRYEARDRAGHSLEIAQIPERMNHTFAKSAAGHKNSVFGLYDGHKVALHVIEVDFLIADFHY